MLFSFQWLFLTGHVPQRFTGWLWASGCVIVSASDEIEKKKIILKLILGVLLCVIMCACVYTTRQPCSEIILWNWVWVCENVCVCVYAVSQVHLIPGNCRWTNLRFCFQWDWKTSNYSRFRVELKTFRSREDLPGHYNPAESGWAALIGPVRVSLRNKGNTNAIERNPAKQHSLTSLSLS